MRKSIWNTTLIVVSPESPRIVKFRFTGLAILILVLSCVMSFLAVVAVERHVNPLTIPQRIRLTRENQQLKATNLNVATGEATVEVRVDQLEQKAQHILELLQAD
jgi:hypothetical protein